MEKLIFVFVHGLSGWGSYDEAYVRMPYWGMRGGDLIQFLREKGHDCYAASVSPSGSAWDRACELYAQLAGRRVDYGEHHSTRCHHERYGRDFSTCPLIPEWNGDRRLVLLGHSFGGATIRLFAELLASGNAEEKKNPECSPLFAGGMAGKIHSIVTLASPMNGTTAYDLFEDPSFHPEQVKIPWWSRGLARMMALGTRPRMDGRIREDYAGYDMHIDRAAELNAGLPEHPDIFYFSVPCSCTRRMEDGTYRPEKGMEPLFVMRACQIGAYAGKTKGGIEIDETWRENDGLVNTSSAAWPMGSGHRILDRDHIERGVWNVFPVYRGDHMALQGGLTHRHDIRQFYLELLEMISSLKADRHAG